MTTNNVHPIGGIIPQLFLAFPFVLALILYILAVRLSNRYHKPWPISRTFCWTLGSLMATICVSGPLANRAHVHFEAHMAVHMLLGMLAPLLMAMAAPMTLLLRTLAPPAARRFSRFLGSWLSRLLTNPVVASSLHMGGLWCLYMTDLFSLMHESIPIYLIVHIHIFLAGYLFTISLIYIDPIRHRVPFLLRAAVFVMASASHGILSKHIYAYPPHGVPLTQAETAGLLMYYGGDVMDIALVCILCLQWFRAAKPRIGQLNTPIFPPEK